MLGDRKKKILQLIIDDYVSTAEPIGSRTIAKKYDIQLSPATIRNEMADLEEMGYLYQPHTSAGRIPSDKAYRLYVDELMIDKNLSDEELEVIKSSLAVKITAIEQLMRQASNILAYLTHYTSVAIIPSIKKNTIKYVQISPVDSSSALLVLVTNSGVVKNTLIKLPEAVSAEFIVRFSNILNNKLQGLTIESITLPIIQQIQEEMGKHRDILIPVLDIITSIINSIEDNEVYLEGASNILDYPEYSSVDKIKEFMNTIETKEVVCKILTEDSNNIKVAIGKELYSEPIEDCSVISTTYSIGGKNIGKVGIIGPKRMDYSKAISSINAVRQQLQKALENWLFE